MHAHIRMTMLKQYIMQPFLQPLCLAKNLWCKLDLRAITNEIQREQNREGRVQWNWFHRNLVLKLAWFPDVANLTFNVTHKVDAHTGWFSFLFLSSMSGIWILGASSWSKCLRNQPLLNHQSITLLFYKQTLLFRILLVLNYWYCFKVN